MTEGEMAVMYQPGASHGGLSGAAPQSDEQ
jgi:hypothetical protein